MNFLSLESLALYWSAPTVSVNVVILMNLVGALLLGLVLGYERTFHGRAAGMRTYGLVCMASTALTVIAGYQHYWFGGNAPLSPTADVTRIVQGIVTGIGFLGAGVIMRDGMSISGLTTAASIWCASAIGILVGVGLYPAAILLTLLSAGMMMWLNKLEALLPAHPAVSVTLRFRPGFVPNEERLYKSAQKRGYKIAKGTIAISFTHGHPEWRFIAIADNRKSAASLGALATELMKFEGVETYSLCNARN